MQPPQPSTNAAPDEALHRGWLSHRTLPVVAIIIVHALGLIALNAFVRFSAIPFRGRGGLEEAVGIVWLATPFAQVSLLAFWTGVSRYSAAVRFLMPLLPLLGICLVSFLWGHHAGPPSDVLPFIAAGAQWLLLALLFDRVYRARGWRLRRKDDVASGELATPLFQFGIKHLLVWTTLIAIVLAIGRVVFPLMRWDHGDMPGFVLFGTFNCIYLIPLMALALRDRGWLMGVILSLAWMALVTLAEREVFARVYANGGHEYLFGLNAVEDIVVVGSLLAVRGAGWRLIR